MSRRSSTIEIVDTVSGFLFPEIDADDAETADLHMSASSSASSNGLSESSDNVHRAECDPATVVAVRNSGHQHENGQPVPPDGAVSQPRPNDLIQGPDFAGDSIDRSAPPDDATMPSKISEPRGCAGSVPASSEEPDRMNSADAGFSTEFHGGLETTAGAETASAGVQPRCSTTVDVPSEDSHELSSVAAPADAEQKVITSDADATAERNQTDLASPDSGSDPALLEDRDGAGREHGDADASDHQKQTAEGNSKVEHFEQGGEPQQTEQGASASEQCADVPTPAVATTTRKSRQSHPKVIVKERDYLSNSEEEILDRLIALKREQYGAQSSPTDEVEAGYSNLLTDHVSCTKTVQRCIPKLIDKGFVVRTQKGNKAKPGSRARYQIVPEQKVEDKRLERGLTHFVEIGLARKAVPDPEQRTESGA